MSFALKAQHSHSSTFQRPAVAHQAKLSKPQSTKLQSSQQEKKLTDEEEDSNVTTEYLWLLLYIFPKFLKTLKHQVRMANWAQLHLASCNGFKSPLAFFLQSKSKSCKV
jgi:hypothetical protein